MNTKENRLLLFSLLFTITMVSCVNRSMAGPSPGNNAFVAITILIMFGWTLYMGIVKKDFESE